MFTEISHFAEQWKQHTEATGKIFNALTDEALSTRVSPEHRDLARMAWHIVITIPEMAGRTCLKIDGPKEDAPIPKSIAEIREGYATASNSLLDQVEKNWTDESLELKDDMYGEQWKRGYSLKAIMDHETHHRGQMTVLMRQAGLKVPGVAGPAKEEWANYGMNEPEI